MAKCGRPPKVKEEDMPALIADFETYIAGTDIPIIAEFAASKGLSPRYFYERSEFDDILGWCRAKKEAALERGALKGSLNPTMSIFSLKQMGWKDKTEQSIEVTGTPKKLEDFF